MTDLTFPAPDAPAASRRYLPWLLLLFMGSGCAALIYEIVWLQMLQLVIGSTAVSLGVLLGTFMGGMCLGSLFLPRLLSARRRPLRVYAALEFGIGVIGLVILFAMPLVERVYLSAAGHGYAGILLRGMVSAMCLLPPTLLMGATLPAIARWLEMTRDGVSWLGFFYGGNIAGAVLGCLLAGFYLLRVHDMAVATYAAVLINFSVALLALGLDASAGLDAPKTDDSPRDAPRAPGAPLVYGAIALSGLSALGAEVVWTRLLSLLLGGTVYAFSVILAVFLIGLGIGSSFGSWWARGVRQPRLALGCCQMLLAAAIAWTAYMIAQSLPYWPINPSLSQSPWFNFQLDLARCLWAVLPPALLWGASFPLALSAVAVRGQDPGRLVGGVYAANTVGAIAGSLWFSLVAIPAYGTQNAQRALIALAIVSALLMLVPWTFSRRAAAMKIDVAQFAGRMAALVFATMLAVALAWNVHKVPDGLIQYGRNLLTNLPLPKTLYIGEGMNSSVAVSESGSVRNFHVSGKIEASTEPQDMRLQRMLGHIPALLVGEPKSVLIVGCGAGVTAGTFVLYPSIERIVICEIEPLIPHFVAPYFSEQNYHVADNVARENPRTVNGKTVQVVYDDGRHFLLTTKEKFDIITSDPIHPWVKGSAALYTREYFQMCKDHLNPGGMVTQWVPLYESTREAVQSELKTFFSVFPDGLVWSNDSNGAGYDTVVLGEANPAPINVNHLQQRLDRPEYGWVNQSLDNVGFHSAMELMLTYGGQGRDLNLWLRDADINRDRDLRLQYLAGLGSNLYKSEDIYNDMKLYRAYPEGRFEGSANNLLELRHAFAPRKPAP